MKYFFVVFGTLFGFLLSRAGATTFDFYAQLFLFENLQLLWVILFAVLAGLIGVQVFHRLRIHSVADKKILDLRPKPMRRGLITGALLFGIGWGLSGSCPGSAPAMLGEGKIMPLFTILGILLGTYLYGFFKSDSEASPVGDMAESSR